MRRLSDWTDMRILLVWLVAGFIVIVRERHQVTGEQGVRVVIANEQA